MFCEIATVICMYVCMYTSLQADWRLNVQLQYNWIQPAQRCWPSVLWQIYCRNSADTSSTYNCALQWGCHDESYRWAKSAIWNKVLPTNQAVRSWLQRCEFYYFDLISSEFTYKHALPAMFVRLNITTIGVFLIIIMMISLWSKAKITNTWANYRWGQQNPNVYWQWPSVHCPLFCTAAASAVGFYGLHHHHHNYFIEVDKLADQATVMHVCNVYLSWYQLADWNVRAVI